MSLPDHYYGKCSFHRVKCLRCKNPVLRSDIVKHCDQDCDPLPVINETSERKIVRLPWDFKEALDQLSVDNNNLQTSVNLLVENVRLECSTLRESLSNEATKNTVASTSISDIRIGLNRMADDLKGFIKECLSSKTDQFIKSVSTAVEDSGKKLRCIHCTNQLHLYLDHWGDFKARATANGSARDESAPASMYGYSVVYVAGVDKSETQLTLCCFLKLVKGEYDSILEWPFGKTYKLSVIHPNDISKTLSHTVNASKYPERKTFHRPQDNPNPGFGISPLCTAEKLDSGGFVIGDTLHLCLEILP